MTASLLVATWLVAAPDWACDSAVFSETTVGESTGPDCLTVTPTVDDYSQGQGLIENTCSDVALTACAGSCSCDPLNLAPDDLVPVARHGGGTGRLRYRIRRP